VYIYTFICIKERKNICICIRYLYLYIYIYIYIYIKEGRKEGGKEVGRKDGRKEGSKKERREGIYPPELKEVPGSPFFPGYKGRTENRKIGSKTDGIYNG
jgi:hypothetical protein